MGKLGNLVGQLGKLRQISKIYAKLEFFAKLGNFIRKIKKKLENLEISSGKTMGLPRLLRLPRLPHLLRLPRLPPLPCLPPLPHLHCDNNQIS